MGCLSQLPATMFSAARTGTSDSSPNKYPSWTVPGGAALYELASGCDVAPGRSIVGNRHYHGHLYPRVAAAKKSAFSVRAGADVVFGYVPLCCPVLAARSLIARYSANAV